MNDISKQATADKFFSALKREGLAKAEAGSAIGFMPAQVSYLANKKYWPRLGPSGWDIALKWVNSGQSLKEYSEKHGRVVPEKKHIELPPKVVGIKQIKEVVPEKQESKLMPEPLIKVKPEALERRKKELEERKQNGLVDMLNVEKGLLQNKIDAINLLLKHYAI